ncbi:hypothetical protein [Brevundimonas sp.]|nr:hypothetical protein [Brevundimonas sp.]
MGSCAATDDGPRDFERDDPFGEDFGGYNRAARYVYDREPERGS